MPTVSEFWDGRAQNYDARVGNHYAEAYEKPLRTSKNISSRRMPCWTLPAGRGS